MKCPRCRFENPTKMQFCGKCGNALVPARQDTPPIDYSRPYSYTSRHLTDKILTSRSAMEGERKLVTVLFSDAVGFTAMSETMDPEDMEGSWCYDYNLRTPQKALWRRFSYFGWLDVKNQHVIKIRIG